MELRSFGVSERRIYNLYPFTVNMFTPSFEKLIEDPASFTQLRRAMHPLHTRSENDLPLAEQYHWTLYYRDPYTLRSFTNGLILPSKNYTAPLAQRMYALHGSDQFSFAKATLLSRTMQMIPAVLNEAPDPSQALEIVGAMKLQLSSITQRSCKNMRCSLFRFAEFYTVTEQLLCLLEGKLAQPIISMKAEK